MEEQYPQLVDRLQSTFIDMMVIIILMFVFTGIMDCLENAPEWVTRAMIACLFLYEPVCTALGCTLGNYIKKIRVRSTNDTTRRINLVQAISRYFFKLLLGWVSFLTIHSNPKRRAIHDMISGSVMIKL
ncbi:hypothetical protein CAP35_12260 [Chitinophagaceae bacterium IBVUCB1]|nr:hypothetical protein CAP35_12260 [Chitinophagaceae bacterium IBVUCB1]